MSYRKFGKNDVLLNTMRSYPVVDFFIYNGEIYFNNNRHESGSFSPNILGVTSSFSGAISLYEYNIDKLTGSNNPIFPFISKDSSGASFKSITPTSFSTEFQYGDRIDGFYPLTASISREFMTPTAGERTTVVDTETGALSVGSGSAKYPHYYAMKNKFRHYSRYSEHYKITSNLDSGWDKSNQELNVIYIPSIFYGSRINPGSVSLKWYVSGSVVAEVQDTKENGELIEVSGSNTGLVAGVVMYNEGIITLTGSWDIIEDALPLVTGAPAGGLVNPKWIYFGAGGNDRIDKTAITQHFASASFGINFQGQTDTQVCTMFAKASKGEANYSNNPTFIKKGQTYLLTNNSNIYEENPNRTVKNINSSSFEAYSEPFERQVYISRIGIYDEDKNLIGVATLSNPILKKEDEDLSFKLKLDI